MPPTIGTAGDVETVATSVIHQPAIAVISMYIERKGKRLSIDQNGNRA
jgi:hypothetical protein